MNHARPPFTVAPLHVADNSSAPSSSVEQVRKGTKKPRRLVGEAKRIIASMPGFVSLELHRGLESPSRYLMLVRWERLEDHTIGFRGSAQYQQWRALLHHFYDPFPTVEHHELVHTA